MKLKGTRGKLPKTRLTKKAGSVKSGKNVAFRFAKGSTHVFKIWGPNIGDLKSLIVEVSLACFCFIYTYSIFVFLTGKHEGKIKSHQLS